MLTHDDIRAGVYANVAENILAALGIAEWEHPGSDAYIFARGIKIKFGDEWCWGGISVFMTDNGRFKVMAYPHTTTIEPIIRGGLTGAQLEDLFIELADI